MEKKYYKSELYKGIRYYIVHTEEDLDGAAWDFAKYHATDDTSEDKGTHYGFKAVFFYGNNGNTTGIVVLVPEGYKPEGTLKDQILTLCKRHGVEFDRIRYYKQSPYQKHRYKAEYVGEEVWLKVDGFNYCFNSIYHCDPLGRIDGFFRSTMGDRFKTA